MRRRADLVALAREVLRVEPFDYTHDALRSTKPYVVIAGGRRSAKSFTAQVRGVLTAATNRDAQVIVVLPNIDNGRRWLAECSEIVRRSRLAGAVLDETSLALNFDQGGQILVLPATPGQLRGLGRRVMLVILEEAGFHPASVLRDLRYTLLDRHAEGAQLWMIGSPWGGLDHPFRSSYERGVDGDPDYDSFRFRTADNPRLPAGWIERERERLAPSEVAAELDGEWSEAVGSLFPRELLSQRTVPIEIPSLRELVGPARPILALDYGVSYDRSAIVAVYRLACHDLNRDLPPKPRFIALPFVFPAKTPLSEVVDTAVAVPCEPRYVATETNGVGAMPSQELIAGWKRRPKPQGQRQYLAVSTSAASKTAAYTSTLNLFERAVVYVPADPDLLRQLAGIKFAQGARGFLSVEASDDAVHDDLADALTLAMLPVRQRGDLKWRCHLARLADPANASPEAYVVPDLAVPVVEAGDGLRVYRRPPLQSVIGTELNLPREDPRPKPPPPPHIQRVLELVHSNNNQEDT